MSPHLLRTMTESNHLESIDQRLAALLEIAERQNQNIEALIAGVGQSLEGIAELKILVEQQAQIAERQAQTAERQAASIERQSLTIDRQSLSIDRLSMMLERVLIQTA